MTVDSSPSLASLLEAAATELMRSAAHIERAEAAAAALLADAPNAPAAAMTDMQGLDNARQTAFGLATLFTALGGEIGRGADPRLDSLIASVRPRHLAEALRGTAPVEAPAPAEDDIFF